MLEHAYLAAGCFWGVEDKLSKLDGVLETEVGYCGGVTEAPTYRLVCGGGTGHAETVHVVFENDVLSFEELLRVFFGLHDPSQLNRQGADVGDNYRSAIFYVDDKQLQIAEDLLIQIGPDFGNLLVTTLEKFSKFFRAESYHQKYLAKKHYV